MKQLGLRLILSGLPAGLLLLAAQPSFANVSGELITGGPGTLTVSATSITFSKNDTTSVPKFGSTQVGAGTDLTFEGCSGGLGSPGCLSEGEAIYINNGSAITGTPVADFMTFANQLSLIYSLTAFEAGVSNTNCSALTVGESCSVFAGSPVILTLGGGGKTNAFLGVAGTVTDGAGTNTWTGSFSTTVSKTPYQLQQIIMAGGSITHTHNGDFTASILSSSTPEPRLVSLAAIAGLFLLIVVQKRRRAA